MQRAQDGIDRALLQERGAAGFGADLLGDLIAVHLPPVRSSSAKQHHRGDAAMQLLAELLQVRFGGSHAAS